MFMFVFIYFLFLFGVQQLNVQKYSLNNDNEVYYTNRHKNHAVEELLSRVDLH